MAERQPKYTKVHSNHSTLKWHPHQNVPRGYCRPRVRAQSCCCGLYPLPRRHPRQPGTSRCACHHPWLLWKISGQATTEAQKSRAHTSWAPVPHSAPGQDTDPPPAETPRQSRHRMQEHTRTTMWQTESRRGNWRRHSTAAPWVGRQHAGRMTGLAKEPASRATRRFLTSPGTMQLVSW